VTDGGPGVPPEHLSNIFDPFFTTKPQGKGLGLSICHSIVRQHGGHIEVRSPPGEGATFKVFLPAAAALAPVTAPVAAAATQTRAAQRILVMDDEDVVRRLAARMLTPLGYEVVGAHDGQEALERYAAARSAGRGFAAVVMDLTVPGGLGGLETIGRLRALDPEVRAIVSSGYSSDPVMANFAQHGFKGVLAKPYLAADLREAIARVLRDVPE
jgi:CheY-like chemotaxis protein